MAITYFWGKNMIYRTGDNVNTELTSDGTTLKLEAPEGYYDGDQDNVTATSADWIASNMLDTATIFGKAGSILTRTEVAATSSSVDSTTLKLLVPEGWYSGSINVTITDADFIASNIKSGVNIFGVAGSIPIKNGDNASTGSTIVGTTLKLVAPTGYYDGNDTVTIDDAEFVADNIKNGVNIFGITGTLTGSLNQIIKTGQTTKYVDGDDGDLETGYGSSPRWVDNEDGTITDNSTNLMWVKDPALIIPGGSGFIGESNGQWATSTAYHLNDLVAHSLSYINDAVWAAGTSYSVGNYVKGNNYGSRWYCIQANNASDHQPESASDWATYWSEDTTMKQWQQYGSYTDGDLAYYMGYVYECLVTNVASTGEPGMATDWQDFWQTGANPQYQDSHAYTTGQVVFTYPYEYTAKSNFTSNSSVDYPGMGSDWATYWTQGGTMISSWMNGSSYTAGDKIYYYNGSYYDELSAKVTHLANAHTPGMDTGWETYWEDQSIYSWMSGSTYDGTSGTQSKVTAYNRSQYRLYVCILDHIASAHQPEYDADASSYWVNAGPNSWMSGTSYVVGQFVTNDFREWVCISDHTSTSDDEPGTGVNWKTYWVVVPGAYVCISAHTSGASTEPYFGASASSKWVPTVWNTGGGLTSADYWNWEDSITNCNALDYATYTDWRMPNIRELESLVIHNAYNPCINATFFPNTIYNSSYYVGYWSSTTDPASTSYAKIKSFYNDGFATWSFYNGNSDYKSFPYNSQYCRPCRTIPIV